MNGKGTIAFVVGLGLLVVTGGAGFASDPVALVTAQLKTAIFHSGQLAVRGAPTGTPSGPQVTDAVLATREHLQHVINCIEGPGGKDFKTSSGYPCQGQGNGILVDLTTAQVAGVGGAARAMNFVNAALHVAMMVVRSSDVNESQPFAAVVARNLQLALEALTR
ncbi:MAG TPA: hypothetical protein VGR25_07125 [bacterium]|jgi:hypothetical protein|nr:hypothetical protein [bacterium]